MCAERGWGDDSTAWLGAGLSDCWDAFSKQRARLSGPRCIIDGRQPGNGITVASKPSVTTSVLLVALLQYFSRFSPEA